MKKSVLAVLFVFGLVLVFSSSANGGSEEKLTGKLVDVRIAVCGNSSQSQVTFVIETSEGTWSISLFVGHDGQQLFGDVFLLGKSYEIVYRGVALKHYGRLE